MALPSGPMPVSTPIWANPGGAIARSLIIPIATWYVNYVFGLVDSIQQQRAGKLIHAASENGYPTWGSVQYYS